MSICKAFVVATVFLGGSNLISAEAAPSVVTPSEATPVVDWFFDDPWAEQGKKPKPKPKPDDDDPPRPRPKPGPQDPGDEE